MQRYTIGLALLSLAALALGVAGCHHEQPAQRPAITQNNPLGMPREELNKVNNMGPQQRAMIEAQLNQMQQRRGTPANAASAPNAGQ